MPSKEEKRIRVTRIIILERLESWINYTLDQSLLPTVCCRRFKRTGCTITCTKLTKEDK